LTPATPGERNQHRASDSPILLLSIIFHTRSWSIELKTRSCNELTSTLYGRGVYGGNWTQLASKLGSGEENYTLKGEEFIQFLFMKSETLDSCRFETKMRQNAPNPISISIFPDPRHWGLCPQTPGK